MRAFMSAVLLLLASDAACAGVVMEMTDKDLEDPQAKPGVQKLSFQDGQFRVDSLGNGRLDASVIYRNDTLYSIDHDGKTYTVVDKATMDRTANQMAEMREKMQAQMKTMPPEQRAMIEKMMQQQGMPGAAAAQPRPKRAVKDTGRSDTAAGRSCHVWEVTVDGVKNQELCVVAPGSLPGGNEVMKAMRDMAEMSRDFLEKIGAGTGPANDAWSDLEQVKGVPILTRDFTDGKATGETRLSAVREEGLGAATFEVPKGFKEHKVLLPPAG